MTTHPSFPTTLCEANPLATALRLPSGLVLHNRLAKSATSEALADLHHAPTAALTRLYDHFAAGGAGMLITGNVMLDARYLERPGNVVVEDDRQLGALTRWAEAANRHGTPLLMQLNHAGRQCNRMITSRPVAPSAGPAVDLLSAYARPRALTPAEILDIIARFGRAAQIAERAGFAGVQVDAAHGYLLSQFLSPRTNTRSDAWGGSLANRARALREAVRAVRANTSRSFSLAVKLNSADFQRGGFEEDEALQVVRWLEEEQIDLLEISGGTYESPALLGMTESTRAREAYFLQFARRVRSVAKLPLMVTGGFRTRAVMEQALREGALDLVGLARPLLVEPDLPARMLTGQCERALTLPPANLPRSLSPLAEAAYYHVQIQRLCRGRPTRPNLFVPAALVRYLTADLSRAAMRALRRSLHGARLLPASCTQLPRGAS